MKHNIKILWIKETLATGGVADFRPFRATIDGVEVIGKIKFIMSGDEMGKGHRRKAHYRLLLTKGCLLSKHLDYKDIRMDLLVKAAAEIATMLCESEIRA